MHRIEPVLRNVIRSARSLRGLAGRLRPILDGLDVDLVAPGEAHETDLGRVDPAEVDVERVVVHRDGRSLTIVASDLRACRRTASAIIDHFGLGEPIARGGRRPGAGRPRGRTQTERVQVYLAAEQAAFVRARAELEGLSASAYLAHLVALKMAAVRLPEPSSLAEGEYSEEEISDERARELGCSFCVGLDADVGWYLRKYADGRAEIWLVEFAD